MDTSYCGSSLSSVHARSTTPGRTKQQKLSTWPFTTPSSPMIPRQNQMIFSSPRYSFSTFSMPAFPRCGFRDACRRHSSVHINVLQSPRVRSLVHISSTVPPSTILRNRINPEMQSSAEQRRARLPLAVGVDGAALQMDGRFKYLEVVHLQQRSPRIVVLLPAGHHRGQAQFLLEQPAVAVVVPVHARHSTLARRRIIFRNALHQIHNPNQTSPKPFHETYGKY